MKHIHIRYKIFCEMGHKSAQNLCLEKFLYTIFPTLSVSIVVHFGGGYAMWVYVFLNYLKLESNRQLTQVSITNTELATVTYESMKVHDFVLQDTIIQKYGSSVGNYRLLRKLTLWRNTKHTNPPHIHT